jgi:hypothetical protein
MKTMQVDETQKKRKHTTKYLIITLTEDDVEFNADKLEERGKRWYLLQRHKEKRSWKSTTIMESRITTGHSATT